MLQMHNYRSFNNLLHHRHWHLLIHRHLFAHFAGIPVMTIMMTMVTMVMLVMLLLVPLLVSVLIVMSRRSRHLLMICSSCSVASSSMAVAARNNRMVRITADQQVVPTLGRRRNRRVGILHSRSRLDHATTTVSVRFRSGHCHSDRNGQRYQDEGSHC
uniref:(northern house mosquito) hypothetical protein n=1 Tax=Culex pipiens TaxID=7175 RepID=A0A8D8DR04_CULPI